MYTFFTCLSVSSFLPLFTNLYLFIKQNRENKKEKNDNDFSTTNTMKVTEIVKNKTVSCMFQDNFFSKKNIKIKREWAINCILSIPPLLKKKKRNRVLKDHDKIKQSLVTFVVAVQSLSHVQLLVIPWTAAHQASLSFTVSRNLLKLMPIESVKPSNHLILCCPLLLPALFPSIRVFSNGSPLHIRCPKYWHFSFSTSPSNEYSGLISFRIDWFVFLAVQGTLRSTKKKIFILIESTNSSALRLLYGPTLTSIHDY